MAKNVRTQINRDKPQGILNRIRKAVAKSISPTIREHIRLRDLATEGWSEENKPEVDVEPIEGAGFFGFRVVMRAEIAEASTDGLTVYQLLNNGTSVRRAKMRSDFVPKTQPGRLGRYGRGGRPVAIRRKFNFKGITARGFEDTINEQLERPLEVQINGGFIDGFNG